MMKALLAAVIFGTVLAATPASANHDTIYSPCSTEYGYIHMTYEEWAAHITTMEADGTIPAGVVFRYWEANHTTGKGTNVQEDGTIPAWDQWARNLTDGQILSIDDWLNGDYPEIEELNFAAGKVPEWILDANMTIRRGDDPYWSVPSPLTPSFTYWGVLCMADLGYSVPVMEINEDGVWVSNLPTTTTTTTTTVPAGSNQGATTTSGPTPPTTTQAIVAPTTIEQTPVPTTTTQAIAVAPQVPSDSVPNEDPPASPDEVTLEPSPPALQAPTNPLPAGYDLFTAQYEGWPFEQTLRLLEERYPQGTPDRYHFRLSVAVDFLRAGGMVGQLDDIWNSG